MADYGPGPGGQLPGVLPARGVQQAVAGLLVIPIHHILDFFFIAILYVVIFQYSDIMYEVSSK